MVKWRAVGVAGSRAAASAGAGAETGRDGEVDVATVTGAASRAARCGDEGPSQRGRATRKTAERCSARTNSEEILQSRRVSEYWATPAYDVALAPKRFHVTRR